MSSQPNSPASSRPHTNRDFDRDLQALRNRLLTMASRVEGMIAGSVEAFLQESPDDARNIIAEDKHVNRDEIDIDALCRQLLALRQPVASDLRFITVTFKMVTDLERIADLAVNICERCLALSNASNPPLPAQISEMNSLTRTMMRQAIESFVHNDLQQARHVIEADDAVDSLYHQINRDLFERMRNSAEQLEWGIHVQSVAKFLERMADHSTNIAEQVIFMLQGEDIRHAGKLEPLPSDRSS